MRSIHRAKGWRVEAGLAAGAIRGGQVRIAWAPREVEQRRRESAGFLLALLAASLILGHYVNADAHAVVAAADEDSLQGADMAIVEAPSNRDMRIAHRHIVRGIEVDPTQRATPSTRPRMRSVAADEARLARRRRRTEVAADVTGRQ